LIIFGIIDRVNMNIHHLELFYYVARHGGISEAVRNIPYGIQQPAVSVQILQLEETLGVTLFHRRPFALSAAGQTLFRFIQPFFEGLEPLADELRGGEAQQLRFGASGTVLRDHLPELVLQIRAQNEHRSPRGAAPDEPRVPGQERPFLARGEGDEVAVLDPPEVDDIVPQDPEPARQPAQHAVGGEAQRKTFDSPRTLC